MYLIEIWTTTALALKLRPVWNQAIYRDYRWLILDFFLLLFIFRMAANLFLAYRDILKAFCLKPWQNDLVYNVITV